jgi:hypothetical protein
MADSGKANDRDLLALIGRGVVPPVLHDADQRVALGLPGDETTPGRYMVELNILYKGGLREAARAFLKLCEDALGSEFGGNPPPVEVSKSYFQVTLSVEQWRKLLKRDDTEAKKDPGLRIIYKLWPDFPVKPLVHRSVATVKADAASRS